MRELWMFMILLGNMLSCAVKSQTTGFCDDNPEPVCVSAGSNVFVPCPNLTDEIRYRLLHGGKVIFNYTFVRKTVNPGKVWADLQVVENAENGTLNFQLNRVNISRYGIYRCEGEIIYPPPKRILNNQSILLLIEGHHCKGEQKVIDAEPHCGFIWILAVVVVSAYGLFVSIFAVVNWVKLRQADTQSDYVNTKPPVPRGYRRKT